MKKIKFLIIFCMPVYTHNIQSQEIIVKYGENAIFKKDVEKLENKELQLMYAKRYSKIAKKLSQPVMSYDRFKTLHFRLTLASKIEKLFLNKNKNVLFKKIRDMPSYIRNKEKREQIEGEYRKYMLNEIKVFDYINKNGKSEDLLKKAFDLYSKKLDIENYDEWKKRFLDHEYELAIRKAYSEKASSVIYKDLDYLNFIKEYALRELAKNDIKLKTYLFTHAKNKDIIYELKSYNKWILSKLKTNEKFKLISTRYGNLDAIFNSRIVDTHEQMKLIKAMVLK